MGLLDGLPEVLQWDPLGWLGEPDQGVFDGTEPSGGGDSGGDASGIPSWMIPALIGLVVVVLLLGD